VGHGVLDRLCHAPGDVAWGPLGHRRRQVEGVDLNARLVHRAAAAVEVPVSRVERGSGDPAGGDGRALRVRPVHARAEGPAVLLDDAETALGEEVGVTGDRGALRYGP